MSATWDPIKPAPPVTSTHLQFVSWTVHMSSTVEENLTPLESLWFDVIVWIADRIKLWEYTPKNAMTNDVDQYSVQDGHALTFFVKKDHKGALTHQRNFDDWWRPWHRFLAFQFWNENLKNLRKFSRKRRRFSCRKIGSRFLGAANREKRRVELGPSSYCCLEEFTITV